MRQIKRRSPASRQVRRRLRGTSVAPSKPSRVKFQWQDVVALIGLFFAAFGFRSDDSILMVVCFTLSAIVFAVWIFAKEEMTVWVRLSILCSLIIILAALGFYLYADNKKRALASNEGVLYPGNQPTPDISKACGSPAPLGAFVFTFGTNIDIGTSGPRRSISVGDNLLEVSVEPNGSARINRLTLYDDRNDVIAAIEDNKLWVHPNARRERPDASTILVRDHFNNEVLNLEFLNTGALRLKGVFRKPGKLPIIITDEYLRVRGTILRENCNFSNMGTGYVIQ